MNGGLAAAAACVGVVIGAESESGPEKICFVYDTQSLLATQFDDDDDGRRVDARYWRWPESAEHWNRAIRALTIYIRT